MFELDFRKEKKNADNKYIRGDCIANESIKCDQCGEEMQVESSRRTGGYERIWSMVKKSP